MGYEEAEDDCNTSSNEGHDSSLHLKECQISDDHNTALFGFVELADVRGSSEARRKIHFEVSLQIEDNRDNHYELIYFLHGPPALVRIR